MLNKSVSWDENKKPEDPSIEEPSGQVPKAGIEPAHLSVHDFESCASTSSAT